MHDHRLKIGATATTWQLLEVCLGSSAERVHLAAEAGSTTALARVARSADLDVVVLREDEPGTRGLTLLLRAAGIPVWRIGLGSEKSAGWGAPLIQSREVAEEALERVAEAIMRPGAGLSNHSPSLSVVVTTLNEGESLNRLVTNLYPQIGPDDEIVIVDGGSADASVDRVIDTFGGNPRVRIAVVPDAGISKGRNLAVQMSKNNFIVCTDAGCDPDADWVDSMRRAFGTARPPGLVSGIYRVGANSAMENAQAMACYYDISEVRRRDVMTAAYTTLFGGAFDPRFCVGRSVGFTRAAWAEVGGFPEHLPTGEDVSFGLAVARNHVAVGTVDAAVTWHQRDSLLATWRMYRSYGMASSSGGNLRLLLRDGLRLVAYLGLIPASRSRGGRRAACVAAGLYLSLPLRRGWRSRATVSTYLLMPVAIVTKDLGKVWGAVIGLSRVGAR